VHEPSSFFGFILWLSDIHSWPWGAERLMNRRVRCLRVSLMVWPWLDSHSQKLHPSGSVWYSVRRREMKTDQALFVRLVPRLIHGLCRIYITALISIGNCNLALVSMSICHKVT
jgi:hypothetical protein